MNKPRSKYRNRIVDPPPSNQPFVLDEIACARLSRAIVNRATYDYQRARRLKLTGKLRFTGPKGYHDQEELESLCRFFSTKWFHVLAEAADLDPAQVIESLSQPNPLPQIAP